MATLFQLPNAVPISAGESFASAKLFFYLAGTTTPITTYTTSALSVAHANPVVADANGVFAPIYINEAVNATYRVQLKTSADVLVKDNDNVPTILSQASIGAVLWPRTAAEIAAGVTPTNFAYEPWDIRRYGADETGSADSLAAFNSAILVAAAASGRTIVIPPGTFKVTGTIASSVSYLHFLGAGSGSSTILFAPTADDVCMDISNGSGMVVGGGIHGIRFFSNDSTWDKVAIQLQDFSNYDLEDVIVGGSVAVSGTNYWSGGTVSTGLRLMGRESLRAKSVWIAADQPLNIADNPNNSLDADHFHFTDLFLTANANPNVLINSGVNVTNLTFDGHQAWVRGTAGLSYVDTTSVGPSYRWIFRNVRGEQGTSTSSYLFDIQGNVTISGVEFDNMFMANDRNGVRLRSVQGVIFKGVHGSMSSREALNVDNTVLGMDFIGCLWNVGSVSITGQIQTWRTPYKTATDLLPQTGHYESTANNARRGFVLGDAISEASISITNNGVTELNGAACGLLSVVTDQGHVGLFSLNGANNTTNEISDPSTVFSTTQGTATSTNVYYNGGTSTYRIENTRGSTRTYKITLLGSYVAL